MKAYLILENGAVFEGESFGYEAEATGELVFNTGMVGYMDTLTSAAAYGQIVVQTFPIIGCSGVISGDAAAGKASVKAYIVREWCQEPSNFRSEGSLDAFLIANKIPALCGVDTRAITRILREQGAMNARISFSPELAWKDTAELKAYKVSGAAEALGVKAQETVKSEGEEKYHLALFDFGAGRVTAKELAQYGCTVTLVPYNTPAKDILDMKVDGAVISDGAGDPKEYKEAAGEIRKLFYTNMPLFGVGLGHQIMALAAGADTEKMHIGHHGGNQPVQDVTTGRIFATSQSHGYTVKTDSLPAGTVTAFRNLNDGTCEGLFYSGKQAMSVQFEPEAYGGELKKGWLYARYLKMIAKEA